VEEEAVQPAQFVPHNKMDFEELEHWHIPTLQYVMNTDISDVDMSGLRQASEQRAGRVQNNAHGIVMLPSATTDVITRCVSAGCRPHPHPTAVLLRGADSGTSDMCPSHDVGGGVRHQEHGARQMRLHFLHHRRQPHAFMAPHHAPDG
jgi:hypothetical protein